VAFLRVLSGECEQTARDYRRHYRSRLPHLIDPTRSFERRHSRRGWPFFLILDGEGNVRYAATTLLSREPRILELLEELAPGQPFEVVEHAGTRYAKATAERNGLAGVGLEARPTLLARGTGVAALLVVEGESGSEVRLRPIGEKAGPEILVSEGYADAFDATAALFRNELHVAFCALAGSGRYDVFVRAVKSDGSLDPATNLTASDDDAMSPVVATDGKGALWIAYTRWHKMGAFSRDKEVYAKRLDDEGWSEEMRLSPDDVPTYEDHTDPAIAGLPGGGVVVAWSWDLHRTEDPKYARYHEAFHAEAPTVFGRRLSADGVGRLLFLGHVGIDGTPVLHARPDGAVWCAWIALSHGRAGIRRALVTSVLPRGAVDRSRQMDVEFGVEDLAGPVFVEQGDALGIVWASRSEGRWRLKLATSVSRGWSTPRVIEEEGDPREPSVVRDVWGRAWIAYTREAGGGRRVVARPLPLRQALEESK
jgi:hypothetical protein